MITKVARFANDCYHIWKAPTGSKAAIFRDLVFPMGTRMGFKVSHFDRRVVDYLYREIFVRQNYYFDAEDNAPVVLDCGANVGMASVYFKWLYPKCRVKAFEPDPATFQLLQQNLAQNRLDVEAYNCALWNEDSELDFFVDSANPGGLLMSTDGSRWYGEPTKVKGRKLSDFIDGNVDFLKLDVEGAEHRVLCDLTTSGKLRCIRQMVIEYHHRIGNQKSCLGDFLNKLERAGFQYQLHASLYPVMSRNVFQDVLIAAYK
jgi:FkbM family methyltransferase